MIATKTHTLYLGDAEIATLDAEWEITADTCEFIAFVGFPEALRALRSHVVERCKPTEDEIADAYRAAVSDRVYRGAAE